MVQFVTLHCILENPIVTLTSRPLHTYNTVFSVRAMVHRQRLALLHIQSCLPHVANNITEGISRVDYAAGSLDLFSESPDQFHLR